MIITSVLVIKVLYNANGFVRFVFPDCNLLMHVSCFLSSIQVIPYTTIDNYTSMVGICFMVRAEDLTTWWTDPGGLVSRFRCRSRYPDRHFPDVLTHPKAV